MVVCICNAIKERDLREAVQQGATSPTSAYRQLGHKPKCAQCFAFAETIIAAERPSA